MTKRQIEGVHERQLKFFEDARGCLVELFRVDDLHSISPEMAYLSVTLPQVTRGPHEHKYQTDVFVFLSEFEVYLWDKRDQNNVIYSSFLAPAGTQLTVPPGVVHAYRNPSKDEARMVANAPDKLYAGWGKRLAVDEIRHETDTNSPYKVVVND